MATTINPQILFNEAKCYLCFEISEDEALELALLARIVASGLGSCTAPSAPTNLLISPGSSNGNIILNWSQGSAPQTNQIWRSTDNGATFTLLSTVAGAVTTFIDASVVPVGGQWYYEVRGCNSTCCSAFTDPAGIFRDFQKTVNTGLVTFSFPFLQFHIGDFQIASQAATTTISVPKLHTCTGEFSANNDNVLTTLVTTSLKTANDIAIFTNPSLTGVSLPALTSTASFFAVNDNLVMTSLSLPLLVSVGSSFEAHDNAAMTTLSVPVLATVGTFLNAGTNAALLSFSFPSLVSAGGDITGGASGLTSMSMPVYTVMNGNLLFDTCGVLVTVSIPNIIFQDGSTITFDSDLLNVASVNQVLARGVASGTTTADYELNTPGNAAPAGQGAIDKATLIGLGNTVNTN